MKISFNLTCYSHLLHIKNDIFHSKGYKVNGFISNICAINSLTVIVGLFVVALVNFSTVRKNMQKQTEQHIKNLKIQSEQQIYSRIMDARLKLQSTE